MLTSVEVMLEIENYHFVNVMVMTVADLNYQLMLKLVEKEYDGRRIFACFHSVFL